jgi:hypothetical protein
MLINLGNQSEEKKNYSKCSSKLRRPYRKSILENLGDLRSMTLGGSPGGFKDSGCAGYNNGFEKCTTSKRIPGPFSTNLP